MSHGVACPQVRLRLTGGYAKLDGFAAPGLISFLIQFSILLCIIYLAYSKKTAICAFLALPFDNAGCGSAKNK